MQRFSLMYKKKWFRITFVLGLLLLFVWIFRIELLEAGGDYLIVADSAEKCEVLFVLGGSSLERGISASEVHERGLCDRIICTGGNIPSVLAALDTSLYEADITRNILISHGVDPSQIHVLRGSTSTWEEAAEIYDFASQNHLSKIGIMSSKHHLRRVKKVFSSRFENSQIQVVYFGAKSQTYDESKWWQSEEGLIMVNNEYMKLLYYLFKY